MSKFIPYVEDFQNENTNGEPLYKIAGTDQITTLAKIQAVGPKGELIEIENPPWMNRQVAFLLDKITDPEFVDGLDQVSGDILREDVRGTIKRESKVAKTNGGYLVEDDEHARRLNNAVMKPKTPPKNPHLEFNNVRFIKAVKNMTTPTKVVDLPPSESVERAS